MLPKAVFLDKDGTLIENVPYNVDPEKIRLTEGAVEGLQLLYAAGFQLIVVSNQAGIARGLFTEDQLVPVKERLSHLLADAGVSLSGFYYCPHHPEGKIRQYAVPCFCRKPNPGMLFQAAREQSLNLADSWFIGDILNDIEAGRRADCRTVLIDNGNETEWKLAPLREPNYKVPNLLEAAKRILSTDTAQPVPVRRAIPIKLPVDRPVNSSLNV